MSSNVPSPLLRKSWLGPFSLPTNKSSRAIVIDVRPDGGLRVGGHLARPLASVTSVNVPSQLWRSRDYAAETSHAPRSTRISRQPSLL